MAKKNKQVKAMAPPIPAKNKWVPAAIGIVCVVGLIVWFRKASQSGTTGNFVNAKAMNDDFERTSLGPDWLATNPDAVKIENGALVIEQAHNRPVWLTKPIPENAVIEFDALTDDTRGDIKVEAWGDGHSFYDGDLKKQYTASGYVFIFGGWKNTVSTIARQWEHSPDQPAVAEPNVKPGHKYHFRISRQGKLINWDLDGVPLLQYRDEKPLVGPAQHYLGFSGWETRVVFDNLFIKAL